MRNQKCSIKKIVTYLNNEEEDGGFWLPNIQRPFVWGQEQITRLFDSIMRHYPISTLLVWKTKSEILHRKFIDNWHDNLQLTSFYVPKNRKRKCLVLDGQQRLQALFIGLKGSHNGEELYFNVLSGEVAAPDDVKYGFDFLDPAKASFPWIKFKDLIFTGNKKRREVLEKIKAKATTPPSGEDADKIADNLDTIDQTFKSEDAITYQELDSIDNPKLYSEDDVVEVFIRANSGGTKLEKSDLLFSLLSASWEVADQEMTELLDSLNCHGFSFDRDFVLKTSLTLLDQGASYEVTKFRKEGVREQVEQKWDQIAASIQDVLDFVRGKTYIQCDKALPSYRVLIPLIYIRFCFPESFKAIKDAETYILRGLLARTFGWASDTLIDALASKAREIQGFNLDDFFGVIRSQGRSLEISEELLWKMGYGSHAVHLLFNLWYRNFTHTPSYTNNEPQIDHIFPQSLLKTKKIVNPQTGKKVQRYKKLERDQLANCMLLSKEENGAGGKSDTPPDVWFADKTDEYLEMHLIPKDQTLWKVERYEDFIKARQNLIREKFAYLLQPVGSSSE